MSHWISHPPTQVPNNKGIKLISLKIVLEQMKNCSVSPISPYTTNLNTYKKIFILFSTMII